MRADWRDETLGGLFEIGSSKRVLQKQWKQKGVPFYRAREIVKLAKDGSVENDLFISEDHFAELKEKHGVPSPGDLMVSAVGTLGACYVVQPTDRFYFKDASVLRFHPKVDVCSRFYQYAFQWDGLLGTVKKSDGATVGTLTISRAKEIPVPFPPLEEQQRIVAVLDKAFEGLARARAHAEANLQNARELFEKFLSGKMLSESDGWATYSFGDSNVLKIVDGDRGANYPKKTDFLSEGHCLFLNTKNVRTDGFNFDETMFISEERDQLLRKGKLLPRDVLLTTRGTIGNIAIFDDAVPYEHIRINSGMLILRPNEDIVRAEFLFELLRSAVIKEQIEEHVSGAAQPQLPIRSLVKFKLPAPKSTKEQLDIVEQLKQLSDKVSDMVEGYETKLQDLDDLRQSLLHKAFAGELT